jgi:hypothetical protein
MKNILVKFALLILKHYAYKAFWVSEELDRIIAEANKQIVVWDTKTSPGTSGEFKRHQVLAALMKKYPKVPNRDVAIAIELAIQGMR